MKLVKQRKPVVSRLPKNFAGYFWDCNFKTLDFEKYRSFILERLLGFGGLDALLWILRHMSAEEIARFLESKKALLMDRKSYLFWKHVLEMKDVWKKQ